MPSSVRIWLEVAHHASFRIGGWAFLRVARDRAKDRGDFTAVIPKSNLAKAGL